MFGIQVCLNKCLEMSIWLFYRKSKLITPIETKVCLIYLVCLVYIQNTNSTTDIANVGSEKWISNFFTNKPLP